MWQETQGPIPIIKFDEISTPVLEKIVQYFYYKEKYDNGTTPPPKFPLEADNLIPILLAANYLDT